MPGSPIVALPELRILLVEDDPDVRAALIESLRAAGHAVVSAADGTAALAQLGASVFDVVVTDVRLPGADGVRIFGRARELSPAPAVILMTSFGSVTDAVNLLKQGAADYLTKPFDPDELVARVRGIAERVGLQRELDAARAQLEAAAGADIVGDSLAIRALLARVATVAASDAPALVTGETGTGKELVARRIHALGSRRKGPFVAVNCAAFPETLLEAELFGYERGAFTGATRRRDGRFQAANGGTLLLDEVAEIPLAAQVKLLRVLQEGTVEPLGVDAPVRVDVRVISATHRDLRRRMAEGLFREDLYYRLNVVTLHVPPLRDRPGDLPLLVQHFLRLHLPAGTPVPEITLRAWQALSAYPFLGNVRELGHAVHHAVVMSRGGRIDLEHLPEDITRAVAPDREEGLRPLAAVVRQAEREHLLRALAVAGGKRVRAAELLGISRKNLWEKLRAHGLSDSDVEEEREP
jgi:two-component system response regulator HydG/two-component system response regulator AtoC